MAFEYYSPQPLNLNATGAMFANYIAAKRQAAAQTAMMKAQAQQRSLDRVADAFSNVGQSFSQGMIDRIRSDRRAEQDKLRDDRQFDRQKQLEKYRSDLDKEEEYFKLSGGMTQEEGLDYGRRLYEQAPPEARARIAEDFGVDPANLDAKSPLYKHIAVTDYQSKVAAQRERMIQARYDARERARQQAEQQEQTAKKTEAWFTKKVKIADPAIEAKTRQTQASIKEAFKRGDMDREDYSAAMQSLSEQVAMEDIEPVIPPAQDYRALTSGAQPVPGRPYEIPDGRVVIYDAKGSPHFSTPVKQDKPEQVTVQPPPPTPVAAPDGSEWIWDGKTYKPHVPKETPEQKQAQAKQKQDEDFAQKLAMEVVTEKAAEGKSTQRSLSASEIKERVKQYKAAKDAIAGKDDGGEPNTTDSALTTPDEEGYSYVDRVKYAAKTATNMADVNAMIGRFKITDSQKRVLYDLARDFKAYQPPTQQPQSAPQSNGLIEGKVYEDAQGRRARWVSGQWVPVNAGN